MGRNNVFIKSAVMAALVIVAFGAPQWADASPEQTKPAATKGSSPKTYPLFSALGKDFSAYAKLFGTKISPKIITMPDFEPGVRYTQAELDALPTIKAYDWKSTKVKGFAEVRAFRRNPQNFVTYVGIQYPKGTKIDAKGALAMFKIPMKGIEIEETEERGVFRITGIVANKNRWYAWFSETDEDGEDKPIFEVVWEEWIP